jgi:hypothetical protein
MTTNKQTRCVVPRTGLLSRLVPLVCLLLLAPALPAETGPTDLQVKAAFLYKFGAFVAWPNAAPNEAFGICVLGRDPFGQILDATLKGETVNGNALIARRIASPQEASQCRIVFVSVSEESRLKPVLTELRKYAVLTVSDIPHFSDRGGMLEFVLDNGRVRFVVNLTSAERSGLALSSQLLKVASTVKRGEGRD